MKKLLLCVAVSALAMADQNESLSGKRTTPPTVTLVAPRGIARGTTIELTVEGLNLAKASAIYFSQPGITGKVLRVKELPDASDLRLGSNGTVSTIDLGPLPPRNQVTVEVDVAADAPIGPVAFRIQTPLGTSPPGSFLIEPYYGEVADAEPNDTPESAVEAYLPAILVGTIAKPGDVDYFKVKVKAGQELVFDNGGPMIGSTLTPIVAITKADGTVLHEFGQDGGRNTFSFAHRFAEAGTYYVRIADYESSGKATHSYRLKIGTFALATSTYPLGIPRGQTKSVAVRGYQLGTAPLTVKGEPSPEDEDAAILRPKGVPGVSFSQVKVALGREPEAEATGTNRTVASAQAITLPVTLNGRIAAPEKGTPVEHFYRLNARKSEPLILEVQARRLGSELDSVIDILDAKGNPIERAVIRPVLETFTTLRDHDPVSKGIRIQSTAGFAVGDTLMLGGEILHVEEMPKTPDSDYIFDSFMNARKTYYDTTPESHAIDKAVYKVQILPPGSQPTPNGLPVTRLTYHNDDGGVSFGKDSFLHFTAPADGQYLVRIRDVRGMGGDDFAYRLTIHPPRPDFRLTVNNRNPNVPSGGCVPLTITAQRLDDFDGPIKVSLTGLPAGLHATEGVIAPGQVTTVVLLSAEPNATLDRAVPLQIEGKATANGTPLTHLANPEDRLKLIALMPAPDVVMTAQTKEIVLEAGSTTNVSVAIERLNEFGGRVPVQVRNLPPRVEVIDVGLNGVLINENEKQRSFTLIALPNAEPIDQLIYVSGLVETRSPLATEYAAPQAIRLRVLPKKSAPVATPSGAAGGR